MQVQLQSLAERARYDPTIAGALFKRTSDGSKWQLRWFTLYQVSPPFTILSLSILWRNKAVVAVSQRREKGKSRQRDEIHRRFAAPSFPVNRGPNNGELSRLDSMSALLSDVRSLFLRDGCYWLSEFRESTYNQTLFKTRYSLRLL